MLWYIRQRCRQISNSVQMQSNLNSLNIILIWVGMTYGTPMFSELGLNVIHWSQKRAARLLYISRKDSCLGCKDLQLVPLLASLLQPIGSLTVTLLPSTVCQIRSSNQGSINGNESQCGVSGSHCAEVTLPNYIGIQHSGLFLTNCNMNEAFHLIYATSHK